MNKKLLMLALLCCSAVNTLLSEDKPFIIKVNPDYYNPFANVSFEWQFSYNSSLAANQYINLHFYIYNRQNNELLESFDKKIMPAKKQGRFYFFISVKPPNTEFALNSPDSINQSNTTSFGDVILNNQRVISKKIIETNINEKTLLVRMEPAPAVNLNAPEYCIKGIEIFYAAKPAGRERTVNYDIYIMPELKFHGEQPEQASLYPLDHDGSKYAGLSKDELSQKLNELLKKRRETEEKYGQNKASISDLRSVQTEINLISRMLKP